MAIGVRRSGPVAGLYPNNAAKLDPVEALRNE
jgi:hypothetical protein